MELDDDARGSEPPCKKTAKSSATTTVSSSSLTAIIDTSGAMDEFLGPPPYACRTCGESFKKQAFLMTHKKKKHPTSLPNHMPPLQPPPPGFKCSKCDEYFPDKRTRHNHYTRTHRDREKYACKVCSKKFYCLSNLNVHEASHSDARPFPCKTCPKSFRTNHHLSKHVLTHSTVRNYICDQCGNAYQTSHYLSNHIRYTHRGIKHYLQVKERERKKQAESTVTAHTLASALGTNRDQEQQPDGIPQSPRVPATTSDINDSFTESNIRTYMSL
jgi:KRAB domain-containing zinc finger protein